MFVDAVVVEFAAPVAAGRTESKKPPCSHARQSGFPCAAPNCVRGIDQMDFLSEGEVFKRTRKDGRWFWYKVS